MRCVARSTLLLLAVFAAWLPKEMAHAGPLRTKATGMGATGTGNGALLVRLSVDDTTGRVEKMELVVETACAFASGKKRRVELGATTVVDLDGERTCAIERSWLCMTMTKAAAADVDLGFTAGQSVRLDPAGKLVVLDATVAFLVTGRLKNLGGTKLGTTSSGTLSGNLAKGFVLKSDDGWSAKTNARSMCVPDGVSRFFKAHDPGLDGAE